jgi:hypothetical protein
VILCEAHPVLSLEIWLLASKAERFQVALILEATLGLGLELPPLQGKQKNEMWRKDMLTPR